MGLHCGNIGIVCAVARCPGRFARGRFAALAHSHHLFDLAHREIAVDRQPRQRRRIIIADHRAGMAHRQFAGLNKANHRLRQRQQALQIGDMAARLIDQPGDLGLGHALQLGQPLIGAGFLDGIEVFALKVFDQCQRHHITIAQIAN